MFEVSKDSRCLQLSFSATLANIDTASEETKNFLQAIEIQEGAFDVILVMREALNNAVKHGSQMNGQKTIKYGISVKANHLIMEIEDEGNGFDWMAKQGKTNSSPSDSGRGWLL